MKKMIASMLLCTGLMAFAQQGERREGHMKDMTPEQMASLQTKKMTLDLDLSTAQQEQIQELYLAQATSRKEKMEARKARTEQEAAEKPTPEDRYGKANVRLDDAIAHKGKLKEILTEAQFEKWEGMHKRKGHHRHGERHDKKRHRAQGK